MREEGFVDFRREGQTLWYRISEPRIEILLGQLQRLTRERRTAKE